MTNFYFDILGEIFGYMLGFGFDPVTNDYKVVRVLHTLHSFPPHVDLYKFSTGVWEDISHVSLSYKFFASTLHAYVNGSSHWIVSSWVEVSLGLQGVIVLFNMHDEKFSELILPSSLINESRPRYDEMFLFVSEGSLCLVDNNYDKRLQLKNDPHWWHNCNVTIPFADKGRQYIKLVPAVRCRVLFRKIFSGYDTPKPVAFAIILDCDLQTN
ncbi:putative F-box protein-like isoform X4 [Capsicum annuum]|nr:putative F-box protein-like isoform X4 [Capsicum annuum]